MQFVVADRDKIDYGKPALTLDVNVIALRRPETWPSTMQGLAQLEFNYFAYGSVELCVTPETSGEITAGTPVSDLGRAAYSRFQKSELFKMRPAGTTISLTDQQANEAVSGIRAILWSGVPDSEMTRQQWGDIFQFFYHYVASGSLSNSALITCDQNFHTHEDELRGEFGVTIYTPYEAWSAYQPQYGLYVPNEHEIDKLWDGQSGYLDQMRALRYGGS